MTQVLEGLFDDGIDFGEVFFQYLEVAPAQDLLEGENLFVAEVEGGVSFGLLEFAKGALEGLDFGICPDGLVTFVYVVKVVFFVNEDDVAGIGGLFHGIVDEILFTVFDTEEGLVVFPVGIGDGLWFAAAHVSICRLCDLQ